MRLTVAEYGGGGAAAGGRKGAVRLAEIIRGSLHNRFFPPDAENSSGRGGRARRRGEQRGQAECSGAVQRAPTVVGQTVGRRRR